MKQIAYANCPGVLQSYLRYLDVVGNRSPKTIDMRFRDIRCFLQYLKHIRDDTVTKETLMTGEVLVADMDAATMAAVTEDDIYDYLEYLSNERKLNESTIFRKSVPSLRQFYEYLMRYQEELGIHLTKNPVAAKLPPAEPIRPSRVLSPSEISRILKAVEGEAAVRDVAIILLIVTTGLTTAEVARARYSDYREDVLLVSGRRVCLTEGCRKALDRYIFEFRSPLEDCLRDNTLFVSGNYLRRLTSRGIQKALQKHFSRAGIDATARDLRHTAVMELLKTAQNECERSYIAGYLGYTNINSIDHLPLPKPPKDDPVIQRVNDTWLGDLGLKKHEKE